MPEAAPVTSATLPWNRCDIGLRLALRARPCQLPHRGCRAPRRGSRWPLMSVTPSLRIGILGAARIAPMALIRPAHSVPGVSVAAVAARDPARARAFAEKHGIPRVCAGYQQLIEDPELDAIYNPLPNSLHCEWTVCALQAGKHVLCEK